jgi:hypothetical protein
MPKVLVQTATRLLRDMSESQLVKMIRAKKLQLKRESLETELDRLNAEVRRKSDEIQALDRRIRQMLKVSASARRGRRGETLGDAIFKTLARSGKPLGLTDITKSILASGYRTQSAFANFRTTVAHTLRRMRDRLARKGDGYVVKDRKGAESPA